MQVESITFDTRNSRIIVRREDGTETVYASRADYLTDWPERAADCDAMGW